jgi:hypothetical protein
MRHYNKYLIRSTDQFRPEDFPSLEEEVQIIHERTREYPSHLKAGIIVSYLKDHTPAFNEESMDPGLREMLKAGTLFTGTIKALFESSRENQSFGKQLENYLLNRLSKGGLEQ